jgi:hypothetical protein
MTDMIGRYNDCKLDRPRFTVYIDDTGFFGTNKQQLDAMQNEYMAAMRAVGLPPKLSKVVMPTCHDGIIGSHH